MSVPIHQFIILFTRTAEALSTASAVSTGIIERNGIFDR